MPWKVQIALLAALLIVVLQPGAGDAQNLRLREIRSKSNRVTAQVGQTVNIEVYADLQGVEAAGISFFITVPDDAFQVIDQNAFSVGVQPFGVGPLFEDATVAGNQLLDVANFAGQQLEYSTVLGLGSNRRRTGHARDATHGITLEIANPNAHRVAL